MHGRSLQEIKKNAVQSLSKISPRFLDLHATSLQETSWQDLYKMSPLKISSKMTSCTYHAKRPFGHNSTNEHGALIKRDLRKRGLQARVSCETTIENGKNEELCAVKVIKKDTWHACENTSTGHRALTTTARTPKMATLLGTNTGSLSLPATQWHHWHHRHHHAATGTAHATAWAAHAAPTAHATAGTAHHAAAGAAIGHPVTACAGTAAGAGVAHAAASALSIHLQDLSLSSQRRAAKHPTRPYHAMILSWLRSPRSIGRRLER